MSDAADSSHHENKDVLNQNPSCEHEGTTSVFHYDNTKCWACAGYYGLSYGQPFCVTCHAFLYPFHLCEAPWYEAKGSNSLRVVLEVRYKSDSEDSGNDEPSDFYETLRPPPSLAAGGAYGGHSPSPSPSPPLMAGAQGGSTPHMVPPGGSSTPPVSHIALAFDSRLAECVSALTVHRIEERLVSDNLISSLPDEVLIGIFSLLDDLTVWCCYNVCTRWRQLLDVQIPDSQWRLWTLRRWPLLVVSGAGVSGGTGLFDTPAPPLQGITPPTSWRQLFGRLVESSACLTCLQESTERRRITELHFSELHRSCKTSQSWANSAAASLALLGSSSSSSLSVASSSAEQQQQPHPSSSGVGARASASDLCHQQHHVNGGLHHHAPIVPSLVNSGQGSGNNDHKRDNFRSIRMNIEMKHLQSDPPEGILAVPLDDWSAEWLCLIKGPQGSPYEGGHFFLALNIPCKYPMRPPSARFLTKIFHPNISRHGDIGIDCIQHNWTLALFISKVLLSIQSLLTDPWIPVCMEPTAARLYMYDRKMFNQIARSWTLRYASHHLHLPPEKPASDWLP